MSTELQEEPDDSSSVLGYPDRSLPVNPQQVYDAVSRVTASTPNGETDGSGWRAFA